MLTLSEIHKQAPHIPGYGGGKWAIYSVFCCWWTTRPQDLGTNGILPCCPHCGSMLMQAPLADFLAIGKSNPAHYGPGGLDNFAAAHAANATTCHRNWQDYS